MPHKIFFKYTSKSRVNNFFRGLDSIVNNLAKKEDYHILCSFDVDDKEYANPGFIERLKTYENVSHYFGISTSKIYAINRDILLAPAWDILVNMSDDFIFTQWGFDDLIRTAFQQHFSDLDGFCHFHDGFQPRLATMSIIGRKWFDRTGYIYHPSYITEYCDVEEQEKAKILGRYKYMGEEIKIMMHIHPYNAHKEAIDELYKKNMLSSNLDKENYFKRLAINFDL